MRRVRGHSWVELQWVWLLPPPDALHIQVLQGVVSLASVTCMHKLPLARESQALCGKIRPAGGERDYSTVPGAKASREVGGGPSKASRHVGGGPSDGPPAPRYVSCARCFPTLGIERLQGWSGAVRVTVV